MELLEEITARDQAADEDVDAQQTFHALAFPARHGARVIQRLTAACGSLVDMGFPHLKRMKKHDSKPGTLVALVVPVAPDHALLEDELREALAHEYDGVFCFVDVLKRPPRTREAWEMHTKHWPLIFHASVAPETQVDPITDGEVRHMKLLVNQAIASGARFRAETQVEETEISETKTTSFCCAKGCVIVDPTDNYSIVADAHARLLQATDAYAFRTLFHPVMIAIDGVAARDRARGGDAGPVKKPRRSDVDHATSDSTTPRETESYLCTGYDVFVDVEPCTLCAMALVHSRARRVIFARPNATDGALSSVFRLHTIKSLNHHYRVFHMRVHDAQ